MKKYCLMFLWGCFLVSCDVAFAGDYLITAPNGLSVRAAPSFLGEKLGTAFQQSSVKILDQRLDSEWVLYDGIYAPFYHVKVTNNRIMSMSESVQTIEGYVFGGYINAYLPKPTVIPQGKLTKEKTLPIIYQDGYGYGSEPHVVGHLVFIQSDSMEGAFLKAQTSECQLKFPVDVLTHEPTKQRYVYHNPKKLEHIWDDYIEVVRDDKTQKIITVRSGLRSEGGGGFVEVIPLGLHYMIYCDAYAD